MSQYYPYLLIHLSEEISERRNLKLLAAKNAFVPEDKTGIYFDYTRLAQNATDKQKIITAAAVILKRLECPGALYTDPECCYCFNKDGLPVSSLSPCDNYITAENLSDLAGSTFIINDDYFQDCIHYDRHIDCSFFTIVIRNSSLQKIYAGGMLNFYMRYAPCYNEDLACVYYMNLEKEYYEILQQLELHNFRPDIDYFELDISPALAMISMEEYNKNYLKSDWLKLDFINGHYCVYCK